MISQTPIAFKEAKRICKLNIEYVFDFEYENLCDTISTLEIN